MSTLMTEVYWVLGRRTYDAYDDFLAAVTDYNQRSRHANTAWNPHQEVSPVPIRVFYEAMWKNEDDTIDILIGEPDTPLTMGQLLFTLNNATYDFFKDADKHFFEGLVLVSGTHYRLMVGS